MAESDKRCVPPCQRLISEDDPHRFCFECLGDEHAALGLEGECEHCNLLPIKVLRVRLAFFKDERAVAPSLGSWGSRVDLVEAHGMGPPLSLALSPDHEVLASASEACFGASSERAEDTSSHASVEMESATSERSSRDDRAYEELLEVVTRAVARLNLDWPQEHETPKRSKLDDRFLSGGRGEGPQRRSLPFFGDLHDELVRSWNKPYSSRVFVPSTGLQDDAPGGGDACGLSLPWDFILPEKAYAPHQALQNDILAGGESFSGSGSGWCCPVQQAGPSMRRHFPNFAGPQICLFVRLSRRPVPSAVLCCYGLHGETSVAEPHGHQGEGSIFPS